MFTTVCWETWDESASGSHGASIPLVFPHLPCTSSHLLHHHTLCPLVLPLPIIMHEYRLSNIKLSIHSVVDSVVVKHPDWFTAFLLLSCEGCYGTSRRCCTGVVPLEDSKACLNICTKHSAKPLVAWWYGAERMCLTPLDFRNVLNSSEQNWGSWLLTRMCGMP